jgi:hypothetical protein
VGCGFRAFFWCFFTVCLVFLPFFWCFLQDTSAGGAGWRMELDAARAALCGWREAVRRRALLCDMHLVAAAVWRARVKAQALKRWDRDFSSAKQGPSFLSCMPNTTAVSRWFQLGSARRPRSGAPHRRAAHERQACGLAVPAGAGLVGSGGAARAARQSRGAATGRAPSLVAPVLTKMRAGKMQGRKGQRCPV